MSVFVLACRLDLCAPSSDGVVSIRTPGPIVEDTRDALQVLALGGRRLRLDDAVDERVRVVDEFASRNDILPTGACTMPVLSTRNSTLPALISRTALPMSKVTVPVFGFGISPRGPSTLPSLPTRPHHVRRRDDGVEVHPAALDLLDHLLAADKVGAGVLRFLLLLAAGDRQHASWSCPGRAAARPCRAPSGRRASDRRRAAATSRRSRRTSVYFTF